MTIRSVSSSAKVDSKGRILLPPDLRNELDIEPGDSVSLTRTRAGLILTPTRKSDYFAKLKQMLETPPKRTGKPENPSPAEMKRIWKDAVGSSAKR